MRPHEEAIKRIGLHLNLTKDKGMFHIVNPTKVVEACVDADFAGSWILTDILDIGSVLSHTCNVIKISN